MKSHFKPLMVLVIILFAAAVAAGVVLLMDDGEVDFKDRVVARDSDGTGSRLPRHIPSETLPEAVSSDGSLAPADLPSSLPSPDTGHLHLIGVATDSNGPFAVIVNETDDHQGLYRTGETVDGAVVLSIQAEKVTLRRDQRLFTLMLESGPVGEAGEKIVTKEPITAAQPTYSLSFTEQADIERAWEETQELMTRIELVQNTENGEPAGVTVQNVAAGSVFETIGLMPGDVILRVDDMEITIADDAMEIYNCLRTKSSVLFTIRRNNETLTFNYDADQSAD